jgi:hypothetical protein
MYLQCVLGLIMLTGMMIVDHMSWLCKLGSLCVIAIAHDY